MTDWYNAVICTPEGVANWLRGNITVIDDKTAISVKMTQNYNTKIEILKIDLDLVQADITEIESKFPELKGKQT